MAPACVLAADGSGFGVTDPPYILAQEQLSDPLNINYTAVEAMQDGAVRLTIPDGDPAPTSTPEVDGALAVSVSSGTIGSTFDSLDSASGWTDTSLLVTESADTSLKREGAGSLSVAVTAGLGTDKVYKTLGAAEDWSGRTMIGFWIRASSAVSVGNVSFLISETSNMSSASEQYALPTLPANVWTYVTLPLSPTTTSREAVLSYGFQFPITLANTYHIDELMAGPVQPTFDGQSVTVPLLGATTGTVVTFAYTNIGAANIVWGPVGTIHFPVQSKVGAGGAFTDLSTPVAFEVYPDHAYYFVINGASSVTAGSSTEITLQAYDGAGNLCDHGPEEYSGVKEVSFSGIPVSPNGAVATVEGTDSVVDVTFSSGTSQSLSFIPRAVGGPYLLDAADQNSSASASANGAQLSITVLPTFPASLVFTASPGQAGVGFHLAAPPVVSMRDAYGNAAVSLTPVSVDLSLSSNPGGAMLHGTTTRGSALDTNEATFSGLWLDQPGEGYVLSASSPGLASATSTPFSVIDHGPFFAGSAATGQSQMAQMSLPADFDATGTHFYLYFAVDAVSGVTPENVAWGDQPMTLLNDPIDHNGQSLYLYGLADPDVTTPHEASASMPSGFIMDEILLLYANASTTQSLVGGDQERGQVGDDIVGNVTTAVPDALGVLVMKEGSTISAPALVGAESLRAAEYGEGSASFSAIESGPFATAGDATVEALMDPTDYLYTTFVVNPY